MRLGRPLAAASVMAAAIGASLAASPALADGAILVMEVGGTYKEQARLCGKIFKQVDGRLLGVVLNRASRRNLGSVYYGYGDGGHGQNY